MINEPQPITLTPTNAPAVVAALAIIVLVNTLWSGFVWDDHTIIQGDPTVQHLSNLPRFFGRSYWGQAEPEFPLYRPLTQATFAIDWKLGGGKAFPFHLTNLLLHLAATLLVFLLLREVGLDLHPAFLGAALFAVHPVHTDAVDSLVQRAEMLAAIGVVGGFWAAIRGRYELLVLAFAVGLLSKESAGVLPLLLIAWHLLGDRKKVARWPAYVLMLVVLLGYSFARWHALGTLTRMWTSFGDAPLSTRLLTMTAVFADYARLLVWPFPLCADYAVNAIPSARITQVGDKRFLVAACALAVLLVAWCVGAVRRHGAAFWGAWVVLALLPVSNLLVPISAVKAERFLYLPSVGACVLLGMLLHRWKAMAIAVVVGFGLLTLLRNPVWSNDESLLDARVADAPDNPFPHYYRAVLYAQEGKLSDARQLLDHALEVSPDFFRARPVRADVAFTQGDYATAVGDLQVVLERYPDSWREWTKLSLACSGLRDREGVAKALAQLDRLGHPADEILLSEIEKRLNAPPSR